jgi:lipopolysaccharide biosynthesis protein
MVSYRPCVCTYFLSEKVLDISHPLVIFVRSFANFKNIIIALFRSTRNYISWAMRFFKIKIGSLTIRVTMSFIKIHFFFFSQSGRGQYAKYRTRRSDISAASSYPYTTQTKVYNFQKGSIDTKFAGEVCVILHWHYIEIGFEIIESLRKVDFRIAQIIITHSFTSQTLEYIRSLIPKDISGKLDFVYVANEYRDSLPFLKVLKSVELRGDCYLKVHTKKSPHLEKEDGEHWRRNLINRLIFHENLDQILIETSKSESEILACPSEWLAQPEQWGTNDFYVWLINKHLGIPFFPRAPFPVGNMYWFNNALLNSIKKVPTPEKAFGYQKNWKDGTWAHAMERLPGQISKSSGKLIAM